MVLETSKLRRWPLLLLLPILFTAIIYLFSTAERAVTDYDEGYYAQVAVHMVENNDWVTPYANGIRFLEKPPLLYWVTAASFKVFGINEFALRLPTALAMIALVWIVMLIARLAAGDEAALISGLSTSFSVGAYLFTRETLHDIWVVLFLALAMYAFLKWYMDPQQSSSSALLHSSFMRQWPEDSCARAWWEWPSRWASQLCSSWFHGNGPVGERCTSCRDRCCF